MLKLVTIRFSHYNEKARWVLDRFGVPYKEKGYMPTFHFFGVWRHTLGKQAGKSDRISTKYSTPLLLLENGDCIQDSSEIVQYISKNYGDSETSLYPIPEALELEKYYHDRLGPHTRRIAYYFVLQKPELLLFMAKHNVGWAQALLARLTLPVGRRMLSKGLGVNQKGFEKSLEYVRKEFLLAEEQLEDKQYLLGDRFTAADLAFACMGSLAVLPSVEDGYSATLPPIEMFSEEAQALIKEMRASKMGQYILRMFREERGKRLIPYR